MHLCVVRGHRDSVWRPEPPPGGKPQGESGPAERRAAGCVTAQKRENEDENRLGVEGGRRLCGVRCSSPQGPKRRLTLFH